MILKCKMCGGDVQLSEDKSIGTCEFCGSTITFPKYQDEQRVNALNRGNNYRRLGEFDRALSIYEQMINEDNTDAEAHWCAAISRFGIEYVEDPISLEYLPTCHRASFDSFLDDMDFKAAIEYSDGVARRQYQKDANKIAEVQKGIIATSKTEDPFDIFICYKETDDAGRRTQDSVLAQEIYYQLSEEGFKVFFARITLEDKVGSEYEPYIFAALNSAKIMIVVGTNKEYLDAVWVKNEWSRFLMLMKKDRSKVLLPCYKNMNPYDMPEAISILQAYDMAAIGFLQDLIRGIKKILGVKTVSVTKKENISSVNNAEALIKRGFIEIEDNSWDTAQDYFEKAADLDPELAQIYLGRLLIEEKCHNMQELHDKLRKGYCEVKPEEKYIRLISDDKKREFINSYVVPGYLDIDMINSMIDKNEVIMSTAYGLSNNKRFIENYFSMNRNFSRALKYAKGENKKELEQFQNDLLNDIVAKIETSISDDNRREAAILSEGARFIEEKQQELYKLHIEAEQNRFNDYTSWKEVGDNVRKSKEAKDLFEKYNRLEGYEDSDELATKYEELYKKLANKEKTKRIVIAVGTPCAILLIVLLVFFYNRVLEPNLRYKKALKLIDNCEYESAYLIFNEMNLDSKIVDNKIERAMQFYENGEYDNAIELLDTIEDTYKNTQEFKSIYVECYHRKAEMFISEENYNEAISIYKMLSETANIKNTEYEYAVYLMKHKEYGNAYERFNELKPYKDSATKYIESAKLYGTESFDKGDYEKAIECLSVVSPSDEIRIMLIEAKYNYASELMDKENYQEASKIYADISDYEDSNDKLIESSYMYGILCSQKRDYPEAIKAFETCGKYKDADSLIDEAKYNYILANRNKNSYTLEYLKDLKAKNYKEVNKIYNELYKWEAKIVVNNNSNDSKTDLSALSVYEDWVFHVDLDGGEPYGVTKLKYKFKYPDGSYANGKWDNSWTANYTGWCSFGYQGSGLRSTGTGTLYVYDGNGNKIGEKSVRITN